MKQRQIRNEQEQENKGVCWGGVMKIQRKTFLVV